MAQYQITLDSDDLHELFRGDEGMKHLLEKVLEQIMEAQVTEQLRAEPYERTEDRQGYRNGYKPRKLVTRVGTLTLRVPQIRNGKFSTELFLRYQRSEQALIVALMEMVIHGVSTRKIAAITEELCGTEFSKSTVSDLCRRLDPIVHGWNERPLRDARHPFLVVDALLLRIRVEGRVCSMSALIAVGVNEHGYREILGLMLGDSESEATWTEFFKWLKGRGLRGVDLVVSDDHAGLVHAIRTHFQGATWQRCQTHFARNILDATPRGLQPELHRRLRALFEAPDPETARVLLDKILADYADRAPKVMHVLEHGFDDATAVLAMPDPYRKRLRTTNGLGRLNEEIRRRERVIRIFPNPESATRLIGALLMEMDEKWSTGHRYFDMTAYWEWRSQRQAEARKDGELLPLAR